MVAYQNAYDSLADFMVTLDPVKVLDFHAPANIQEHVEDLLEKKQEIGLSLTEQEELDHYFILEHIVRLAKSRARRMPFERSEKQCVVRHVQLERRM